MASHLHLLLGLALLLSPCSAPQRRCVRHVEVPIYPNLARVARIQGDVEVSVRVNATGGVTQATARSGHEILRRSSEENVRRWTFEEGEECAVTIVYEYRLKAPAVDYMPAAVVTFDLPVKVTITSRPMKVDHPS